MICYQCLEAITRAKSKAAKHPTCEKFPYSNLLWTIRPLPE